MIVVIVDGFFVRISWMQEVAALMSSISAFVFVLISRAPNGNDLVEVMLDLVGLILG